ncbi:hypothetical protein O0L34_g14834 [Tuta absoluta]|nr:hypothetical protein O0L34_g14834 [Tuta absoluta]
MAPLPQEGKDPIAPHPQRFALTGEEVVISGISGQFPNSKNVVEFMDNLYNKVDMITKNNPMFEHADLPPYSGKISEIEKFDAQFFRVTAGQADSLDPVGRKLMEHAYGALYDAGVNPISCKGKNIGVFISAYNVESCKLLVENINTNPFIISGSCKTMHANRISYWLDAKGPSFTFDSPAGSIHAVQHAVRCIKSGECDAAIVGSGELPLDPILNINMRKAGISCLDSKTRCFEKNGDGSVLSHAVGLLFLQKAKDAKRIYAEIYSSGMEYGLKDGANINQTRDQKRIVEFLTNVYSDSGLQPHHVEYVEAHGAAQPEADTNELEAIAQVFGKQKPVMVGCVKSNMGDSLPASSICSITKLCLAYYKGQLPGNLNMNDPLDIPALKNGKIVILTDNKSFTRGLTAINSFSHTGSDSHLVLKGHIKPKNMNLYKLNIPRLVLVSGRNEKAVKSIFNKLKNQPLDAEFIGMLNDIYQVETPGFTCRGYTILDTDTNTKETITLSQSTHLNQEAAPPLWLLYSGMGSQWAGMGKELMRIPMFATSVKKCHRILEPKGVDVIKIITSPDKTLFDNVLNCFIGIAAVQIGLTNMLKELGLVADNVIGHSVGELGCAHYDGCFTDEEMILAAHARGLASIQTKLIKGSMAAVGLGYADILPLCPPGIDVACHNSSEVCTISGPADDMKTFVADLTARGIFAREVPCGNIAYHSRYIQDAGPALLKQLKDIIKNPRKRSENWISTSWPDNKRNSKIAEMCSAEYHTNNLLSPVYFEEAAKLIPENAVVVEVAPHGLMQAIMKRSHPKCTHIPLTRRDQKNPLQFLFEAFGKLYEMGYNLKVNEIYPKIQYPVSTETSPLSHLVEWYHEDDWLLCTSTHTRQEKKKIACSRYLAISIEDDDFTFLSGHVREGKNVLPEAAVLVYVWETLAMYKEVDYTETSVVFRDVHFHTEVLIGLEGATNLKISINKGNHYFEVTKIDVIVASGYINTFARNTYTPDIVNDDCDEESEILDLSIDDVYQILKLKGYSYRDDFQRLYSASHQLSRTKLKMDSNWVTFLDSLIQFNILTRDYDGVSVPKIIKSLKIDTTDHFYKSTNKKDKKMFIDAHFNKYSGAITCGGVKIEHIVFNDKPIRECVPDVLETVKFDNTKKSSKIKEFKLINAKPGDVAGMQWEELAGKSSKSLVKVCFAAPSMRDVENAVGTCSSRRRFGMDYSGIDSNGNRVMGLAAEGALASTIEPDKDLLWPVPKHWTLEEAATVPLPYVHAYYCLVVRGCLRAGQTVFITGGAGALGQAAISICLSLGCTVYTSVCDITKKRFLMKLFPGLNENRICFSRDIDFYNTVVCNSRNKRCDFVINCATGLFRELAMKCVAFTGVFLDVTDYDMRHDRDMGMVHLDRDRAYVTVDLSYLFKPDKTKERKLLHTAISEGIANGTVKPLSHVVYSAKDVIKAFRLISHSKHRGRVLIKIRDTDASMIHLSVIPRKICSTKSNFLIVCDETELGIQLANHLVKRGAKNLILHLKSNKVAGFIQIRMARWSKMGVRVRISTGDLEQRNECLKMMNSKEILHGIFIIEPKQSSDIFCMVVRNLDIVSRNNHPGLEHFVILARNPKENTARVMTTDLNNIINKRAEINLPALLMHAELEVCEAIDKKHSEKQPITVNTAFKVLEASLRQDYTNVSAYNKTTKENNFFEQIAVLLGVKSLDALDDKVCIKDLVLNHVNMEELKFFIMENYNIDYSTDKIGEMTIQTFKNMCTTKIKENTKFNAGLAAFYNKIKSDPIEATEIFIPIPTLSSAAEGERTLHAKATNVMLIPGFEGDHQIFMSMAERIKIRATALQLGPDIANESIQQIALNLKQRLKSRFVLKPKFYLLGYSFGVNVALELAALLEKDGLVGIVYCLDSSPDALRVQLDAYLGKLSEEQLQNAVIKHIYHLITGSRSTILEEEVENTNAWDEKVKQCVQNLKNHVTFSKDYMRDIIKTFYKRIGLAKIYKPQLKLKSDIVLLKGISHPNAVRLDDDYGLSKYSENPVKVFGINSDVALAPYDCRVANVLNNLLEPALLDEFKAKNLCECYV